MADRAAVAQVAPRRTPESIVGAAAGYRAPADSGVSDLLRQSSTVEWDEARGTLKAWQRCVLDG